MEKKSAERPDAFTKDQVLSSVRYQDKRDVISVVLDKNKTYSLVEVDALVNKFMERKVK